MEPTSPVKIPDEQKPKKICIYTCIYGNYDKLQKCPVQDIKNCDYICLTDNPNLKSGTWKIHIFTPSKLQVIKDSFPAYNKKIHANMVNTMLCRSNLRLIPVLANYDICVYIDGNVEITNHELISNLLLRAKSTDLLILAKHRTRQNVYQEAIVSSKMPKYKNTNLQKQTLKYKNQGFPTEFPLFSNNFMVYLDPHSPLMDNFYTTYTQEAINYCINQQVRYHCKGQVSLPYVLWKTSTSFCMVASVMDSKEIQVFKHK